MLNNKLIARTSNGCYRVLETSHPPTYYLPLDAITPGVLRASPSGGKTMCEWKVCVQQCVFVVVASRWVMTNTRLQHRLVVDHCSQWPSVAHTTGNGILL